MTFEEALKTASFRPNTPLGILQAGRDLLSVPGVWVQSGGDLEHRCAVTSMWRDVFDVREVGGELVEGSTSMWTRISKGEEVNYYAAITELTNTLVADGEYYDEGLHQSPYSVSVAGWNDREGRTVEDVLSLFDRTIARLEEATNT